jgi:Fe2+ or Zn2+ uptake regulation protein
VTSSSHVELTAALRDAGLRVTSPRLAVLSVVMAGKHMTAEQVEIAARERVGAISTQAVYDVLAALTRGGFLRRIEPAGSPAATRRASTTTTTTWSVARAARSATSTASSEIRRA